MEVSLVENMPSVSLCKKLLNHLHFICLARGLDVTRPVIITNALTSINNHIIIEHNNYYLSFLQDMFPYFEKYGLINVLPDIISRIELLMNEKESTINELFCKTKHCCWITKYGFYFQKKNMTML